MRQVTRPVVLLLKRHPTKSKAEGKPPYHGFSISCSPLMTPEPYHWSVKSRTGLVTAGEMMSMPIACKGNKENCSWRRRAHPTPPGGEGRLDFGGDRIERAADAGAQGGDDGDDDAGDEREDQAVFSGRGAGFVLQEGFDHGHRISLWIGCESVFWPDAYFPPIPPT